MSFIIENFELLSERPEHVMELKQLILETAFRGKLSRLNDIEETAGILLDRIKEHKKKQVEKGEIKKSKPLELKGKNPYKLPIQWVWCRLNDIASIVRGGSPRPAKDPRFYDGKIPFLKVADLTAKDEIYLNTHTYSIKEAGLKKTRFVQADTVLLTNSGATLGVPKICTFPTTFNDGVAAFMGISNSLVYKEYLYFFLKSKTKWFLETASRGQGQPNLNTDIIRETFFPLPPYKEQLRIVEKVNSLFQKIDALADQTQRAQITRQKLRTAFLHRLDQADSATQLSQAWQSLIPQFDRVFDSVEAIKALRKSILQLAVKGKLVEQNGEDESASVLLEKIKKQKDRLVEEKKIKKQKALPKIEKEEIPYGLPKSWEWCVLNDLCLYITDGTHQTPKYTEKGRMFLSAKNVKPFKFMPDKCRYVSEEHYQGYIKNRKPELNDVLLTRVGSNIGEAAKINVKLDFAIYVSVALIKPIHPFINPDYLVLWLNSPSGTEKSISNTYGRGMSQGNLNLGQIRKFAFPLPPLAEQKRIVEKVGQLMSFCDDLESLLEKRAAKKERLLGRVLKGVFEGEVEQV